MKMNSTTIIVFLVVAVIIVFLLTRQHKGLGLFGLSHTPKLMIVKDEVQAMAA